MNTATFCRLSKETRALLPVCAVTALLLLVLHARADGMYWWLAYCFGCALLGATCFGHEFNHRTMSLLLSQPMSRGRLWWEKMVVLGAALVSVLLLFLLPMLRGDKFVNELFDQQGLSLAVFAAFAPAFVGFCTGPLMTLLARGTIGGTALTFICPWTLVILGVWLEASLELDEPDTSIANSWLFRYMFLSQTIYCGLLLALGFRRFHRFEDADPLGQELSLPAPLTAPFASLSKRLALGDGGALANLVKKELRLQEPTLLLALLIVAIWLALVAVKIARPSLDSEFLFVSPFVLSFAIAVVAGILSVAEERNLGLHEWHLSLPLSARRQWLVKVLVTLAVNAVLGLLLPWLLWRAVEWQTATTRDWGEFVAFSIFNLMILCAAIYASSTSTNSLRALVGTIVLCFAAIVVVGVASHWVRLKSSFPVANLDLRWLTFAWGGGGVLVLLGMLFEMGLANYRRALGSFWYPVRQMLLFFAVICFLKFGVEVIAQMTQR